jgi:hypothetical protein
VNRRRTYAEDSIGEDGLSGVAGQRVRQHGVFVVRRAMASETRESLADVGAPGWAQALNDLELSLQEASEAVAALRRGLAAIGFNVATAEVVPERRKATGAPAETMESRPKLAVAKADPDVSRPLVKEPAPVGAQEVSSFDRLWDKIERERSERADEPKPLLDERRGLDLLPQQYLMTVEDREGKVSLVPLHRGLQGLDGIEEVTLVSYANGVPVISLRSKKPVDMEMLREAVSRVMDRHCEVIQQDTGRLYLRLRAHSPGEES